LLSPAKCYLSIADSRLSEVMSAHKNTQHLKTRNTTGETLMNKMQMVKGWIGALTDIGLMLLALAIVATLLVGANLPFFGGVVGNIVGVVKDLGSNGLVGLIAVGIILWLFSGRKLA
jgi:hypothetical protein